jgi:hypothetical protein
MNNDARVYIVHHVGKAGKALRVSITPGENEIDDAVWNKIKDTPFVKKRVNRKSLAVVSAPKKKSKSDTVDFG